METFAEVRKHVIDNHRLFMDEPFQLGFDLSIDDSDRKQSVFLAEFKSSDNRRYLRV